MGAAARLGPGPDGNPVGNAVEPGAHTVAVADRARPADQHQERGLEGVLDLVRRVVEHAAADTQDHRPMPGHQRREGRLVAAGDKPLEQLPLGQPRDRPLVEDPVQLYQDGLRVSAHDDPAPPSEDTDITFDSAREGFCNPVFFRILSTSLKLRIRGLRHIRSGSSRDD